MSFGSDCICAVICKQIDRDQPGKVLPPATDGTIVEDGASVGAGSCIDGDGTRDAGYVLWSIGVVFAVVAKTAFITAVVSPALDGAAFQ